MKWLAGAIIPLMTLSSVYGGNPPEYYNKLSGVKLRFVSQMDQKPIKETIMGNVGGRLIINEDKLKERVQLLLRAIILKENKVRKEHNRPLIDEEATRLMMIYAYYEASRQVNKQVKATYDKLEGSVSDVAKEISEIASSVSPYMQYIGTYSYTKEKKNPEWGPIKVTIWPGKHLRSDVKLDMGSINVNIAPKIFGNKIAGLKFSLGVYATLGVDMSFEKNLASEKPNPLNRPKGEVAGGLLLEINITRSASSSVIVSVPVSPQFPLPEMNLGIMTGTIKAGELFLNE